ncbi:PIN domain-containing protein [Paractinoplanes atraurantiacus]|uniref:Ribonuclease VapC n=1 Tax=Paractinoplanes atraurantiacus TaxID=1036182 RepID=A0A285J6F9_9ACTN|nr:PIN domain-containing protein [Actinoplanes atraurantiacus]SNY55919.1 hypothetical protein SAMN05421748_11715 [Actinoplanes atraurantiacus]
MRYLVDASALIRILRSQVDPAWEELADRGLISICEPALAESLKTAEAQRYAQAEEEVARKYPPVTVPEDIWEQLAETRRELARHAVHGGPSVVDIVIALTAMRLKLTVLHQDRDFETIGKVVPELRQRSIRTAPD